MGCRVSVNVSRCNIDDTTLLEHNFMLIMRIFLNRNYVILDGPTIADRSQLVRVPPTTIKLDCGQLTNGRALI